jgi:hypothetical protein
MTPEERIAFAKARVALHNVQRKIEDAKRKEVMAEYNTPKIPKAALVHGEYYVGHCRNACIARWNAEKQCFYHWRTKFGQTFIETIRHPEDDQTYDVFVVEGVILGEPDNIIPFTE